MEIAEPIESINSQLIDLFGIDTLTGRAIWRIVWSEDQYEKRLSEYTPEGLHLLHPKVMEMKKYPYIKEKFILERLVIVPEINADELPTSRYSYEPMFQFCHALTGEYMPPTIGAAKFIVDTVYAAMGKASLGPKYIDPSAENPIEARRAEIKKLEEELFGDESGLAGKTHLTGEGIVVPSTYETTNNGEDK